MAMPELIDALATKYGVPTADVTKKNPRFHYKLNGESRGRNVVSVYEKLSGRPVTGLDAVDVGCGYGGVAVELWRDGATVEGIDLSNHNLRFAKIYASGLAKLPFINMAADAPAFSQRYGPRKLDLICVTSVMEHIFRIERFVANAAHCLRTGGHVYFTLPNPLCLPSVLKEPHTGKFGLSLIPTDAWFLFWETPGGAYYREQVTYDGLFHQFGFSGPIFEERPGSSRSATVAEIRSGLEEVRSRLAGTALEDTKASGYLTRATDLYCETAEFDIASGMSAAELQFRYLRKDHTGIYTRLG